MINVFIDANIWLSLYDFSSDDLEQFSKLSDLIGTDVEILLPQQIRDEVYRNREKKIKGALDKFSTFQMEIPNICKGYDEYQDIKNNIQYLKTSHKAFVQKIKQDVIDEKLHADKVIKEIFKRIKFFECTDEILMEAKMRFDKGNPPGKDRLYGDAINWVTLLRNAPKKEDLFFVSADKDYSSAVNGEFFNSYLLREWRQIQKSELFFFTSLKDFINLHVQKIELKSENEKNELIDQLRRSPNFTRTHNIIENLNRYTSWATNQVEDLCWIANNNFQVGWIIGDDDVYAFYSGILHNYHNEQADECVELLKKKLSESREEE